MLPKGACVGELVATKRHTIDGLGVTEKASIAAVTEDCPDLEASFKGLYFMIDGMLAVGEGYLYAAEWRRQCIFETGQDYIPLEDMVWGTSFTFKKGVPYRCLRTSTCSTAVGLNKHYAVLGVSGFEAVIAFQKDRLWFGDDIEGVHSKKDRCPDIHAFMFESAGMLSKFPHSCPRCKCPAYIGFNDVDCVACGRF